MRGKIKGDVCKVTEIMIFCLDLLHVRRLIQLTKSSEMFVSVTHVWLSLLTITLYDVTQSLLFALRDNQNEKENITDFNSFRAPRRKPLSSHSDAL